jgi:hypothetical protein
VITDISGHAAQIGFLFSHIIILTQSMRGMYKKKQISSINIGIILKTKQTPGTLLTTGPIAEAQQMEQCEHGRRSQACIKQHK